MPLSIVQITFVSPLQQSPSFNLNPSTILPKTLFPPFETEPSFIAFKRFIFSSKTSSTRTKPTPMLLCLRLQSCGLVGSASSMPSSKLDWLDLQLTHLSQIWILLIAMNLVVTWGSLNGHRT